MKLTVSLFAAFLIVITGIQAQTLEDLKALKLEKEMAKEVIDLEIAALKEKIRRFPGWSLAFSGLAGVNLAGAKNWYANDVETVSSTGFELNINAHANANMGTYFFRNGIQSSISTSKATIEDRDASTGIVAPKQEIKTKISYLELSNQTGYYFIKKWDIAATAKSSYTTTVFEFNDPAQLTFSSGVAWTPVYEFYIYAHPLGYQWTFPTSEFATVAGAEIGAAYVGSPFKGVICISKFDAFIAYSSETSGGAERTPKDLTNWNWVNKIIVLDIFNGFGIGGSLGLRSNKQLGYSKGVGDGGGVQAIYSLGVTYTIDK